MALSFANQLLSIILIAKNYKKMGRQVYSVPKDIDRYMEAFSALEASNLKIECHYANSKTVFKFNLMA